MRIGTGIRRALAPVISPAGRFAFGLRALGFGDAVGVAASGAGALAWCVANATAVATASRAARATIRLTHIPSRPYRVDSITRSSADRRSTDRNDAPGRGVESRDATAAPAESPVAGRPRAVVLGAGPFGTAVAVLLARGGFRTTLQTRTASRRPSSRTTARTAATCPT